MKPSSRCALAATLSLAVLIPPFAGAPALASGPVFAGHAAHGQGGFTGHPAHGVANGSGSRPPTRIFRRAAAVYGGYTPYLPTLPADVQPAPVVVENETPVYVNVGGPSEPYTGPLLCNGPEIIEIGKPRKTHAPLPRVIYGTPFSCVAARASRGPGIYSFN